MRVSYVVVCLKDRKQWGYYDHQRYYSEAEAINIGEKAARELHLSEDEEVRILSGYHQADFDSALSELNNILVAETIGGLEPEEVSDWFAKLKYEDRLRIVHERGYGTDKNKPYEPSLTDIDLVKLRNLIQKFQELSEDDKPGEKE
jgi:hypothetical protein